MPVLIDGPANAAGQAWCLIDAYRRENALLSLATSPAIDLHAKAVANLVVDPKFSGKIPDYIQQSVTDDLTERGFDSVYLASVKFHGNGENLYNAIHAEPVALQAISCASHAFIGLSVSQDYAVMIAATAQEEMNAPENFFANPSPTYFSLPLSVPDPMPTINIKVKPANDSVLEFDIDPETTKVSDLKELISQKHKDAEPGKQRLIYSGRILKSTDDNNKLLSEYNVKDGNTIHLVVSKKEPAAAGTSGATTATASAQSQTTPQQQQQ
ncbi:hypothetical protein EV182_002826, partial [Spiromyces aspiralis]